MPQIYLIRHAQANFGHKTYDQLSDIGHQQAQLLATFIASMKMPFDQVHHGSLRRQIDTAKPLLETIWWSNSNKKVLQQSDWLNELNSQALIERYLDDILKMHPQLAVESKKSDTGQWLNRANFDQVFSLLIHHWQQDKHCPFQTFEQFQQEIFSGLTSLMDNSRVDERIILVTSGGVIASILQKILSLTSDKMLMLALTINNASVTEIWLQPNDWLLQSFNNISPFQLAQKNSLITRL